MLLQKKDNRNWVFWLTLFVLFCLGVYALKSVLLPFVAGIIIGYLLDPWADCFVRHGINRTLATVLVLLLKELWSGEWYVFLSHLPLPIS